MSRILRFPPECLKFKIKRLKTPSVYVLHHAFVCLCPVIPAAGTFYYCAFSSTILSGVLLLISYYVLIFFVRNFV